MDLLELQEMDVRSTVSRASDYEIRFRPHRLTVFVPSSNGDGEIPKEVREHVLARCREVICSICGGATEWDAKGYWLAESGFVSERITVITAFVTCDGKNISTGLMNLCRWIKEILQQEKVAFEVDSRLYLI